MKFDTTRKRIWIVLAGLWILLSLVLSGPFSHVMLGDEEIIHMLFSFVFLALSPFIAVIHDWVFPGARYRWFHLAVITLASGFLCFVASHARSGEEVAMTIIILWWGVFSVAYGLTGDPNGGKMPLRFGHLNLIWLWGIVSATTAMFGGIVVGFSVNQDFGPLLGQLAGLTIWAVAWYGIRREKPQLYRWRNFLFVLIAANWSGIWASFGSPSGYLLGLIVLLFGIAIFVIPRPKELQLTRDVT
ncbi:hypothetical protein [Sedimentimonas flavescens]|uniref:hypothetical protein n=1 Tax=Sedimentimonas flavescens TaxID=2851012 RepID=UPI0021A5D78D|nr:hypothetical protein [Sedimentimonas flavescens]MCT2538757.1 hypothetical protein [Sedimentimonas flavescens]